MNGCPVKEIDNMLKELKEGAKLEVKPNSEEGYLEAVVNKENLEKVIDILTRHLGPAAKESGKDAKFSGDIQKLVDLLGGLRKEQSFFFKHVGAVKVNYAALWPWQSDPDKITIKAGEYDIPARRKFLWWS